MTQLEKDQKLAEISVDIENYETTLAALKSAKEALESLSLTTPHKVWEPGGGDRYYAASTLSARGNCCTNYDFSRIEAGLTHPTKEAAERHHSFLVMLHDLHKFAVEHNEGWKPDWALPTYKHVLSRAGDGRIIVTTTVLQLSPLPHFESKYIAQKAIDTFGEERLKILFEYYNS